MLSYEKTLPLLESMSKTVRHLTFSEHFLFIELYKFQVVLTNVQTICNVILPYMFHIFLLMPGHCQKMYADMCLSIFSPYSMLCYCMEISQTA